MTPPPIIDAPVQIGDVPDEAVSFSEAAGLVRRALGYVAPFKWRYIGKILIAVGAAGLTLLMPWPMKIYIDYILMEQPVPPWLADIMGPVLSADPSGVLIAFVLFEFFLLTAIGAVSSEGGEQDSASTGTAGGVDQAGRAENEANRVRSGISGLYGLFEVYWALSVAQRINHLLRSRLYQRFQRLPVTAYGDQRIGDAVYRTVSDTASVNPVLDLTIHMPIFSAISGISALVLQFHLFREHPFVLYLTLSAIPIGLVAGLAITRIAQRQALKMREAGSVATATVEEGLSSVAAVQAFGQENREKGKFNKDSWGTFSEYRKLLVIVGIAVVCMLLAGAAVYLYGQFRVFKLVVEGKILFGDMPLIGYYVIRIVSSVVFFSTAWIFLQSPLMGLKRVFTVMDKIQDAPDRPDAVPLTGVTRDITFDHVWVEYIPGTPVLEDVSLTAQVGQTTAIVGYAGSGKTTLVNCIPRFLEASRGRVLIDDRDIHEFTAQSLREQVSFVFQEDVLVTGTIRENICYGKPDATDAEMKNAARIACADEFIESFPNGYDTMLGRRGGKLSVGQKQRICIARALLKESSVLILDEPTSALDARTEERLLHSLNTELTDKIVIVIAHRLSTIRTADQVLFMDLGRIIEQGTFDELRHKPGGKFARFCDIQHL